jgi:arginine-tRNA-protein transferase
MQSLIRFVTTPSQCGYLPEQLWRLEYDYVAAMTTEEYLERMLNGWRRFGNMLFRPACPHCTACRPLRVRADAFRPDRSQRRAARLNEGEVALRIGKPSAAKVNLSLYDRYHAFQSQKKGWPEHPAKDVASYAGSFVEHPFPVEEWCYYHKRRLVGVGYVDHLPHPDQGGLSAIYFFYEPSELKRSLGTWNLLCLLAEARRRGLPWVYLGYYVAGCPSMSYKLRFRPNQLRELDGVWRDFSGA